MREITTIVAHCSDTPDSPGLSWDDIERFQMSYSHEGHIITIERARELMEAGERVRKPWVDLGYHAGAEYVGDSVVCMYGRPFQIAGAHVRGHNANSLGFMFCGDFDHEPPAEELLVVAARRVLAPWCRVFNLPLTSIKAHRDFDSGKTCPGSAFDMDVLRATVAEFL